MKRIIAATFLILALSVPAHAQEKKHHFWKSKKFWIAFVVDSAATAADYYESQGAFSRGSHETNPIFGAPRPSFGRMSAIGLPITFAMSYASFRVSESNNGVIRRFWWAPVSWNIAEHSYFAAKASRYARAADACSVGICETWPHATKH